MRNCFLTVAAGAAPGLEKSRLRMNMNMNMNMIMIAFSPLPGAAPGRAGPPTGSGRASPVPLIPFILLGVECESESESERAEQEGGRDFWKQCPQRGGVLGL